MIQIKREFNNGLFDCQEIYDNEYKILEKTNGTLWNTDKEHIIVIAKDKKNNYIPSNVKAEKIEEVLNE